MKTIVATPTPLILLDNINKLDLLFKLFDKVEVPEEVYKEAVVREESDDRIHTSFSLNKYIAEKKLEVVKLDAESEKLAEVFAKGPLSTSVAHAIAYAVTKKREDILIGGPVERAVARSYNLKPFSTFRLILLSYKNKIIGEKDVKKIIDSITKTTYHLSPETLAIFWDKFEKLKKVMETLSDEM